MSAWLAKWLNRMTAFAQARQRHRPPAAQDWVLGTALRPQGGDAGLVTLTEADRERHIHILGGSGSGKTRLIQLLARQAILHGAGLGIVDPHGDLCDHLLRFVCDESQRAGERDETFDLDRLYPVAPFVRDFSLGWNPLDPGGRPLHPHISSLVGICHRLWETSWGPRMEALLLATFHTLALVELTLAEVEPLLTDRAFRRRIVGGISDERARSYWSQRYDPLPPPAQLKMCEPVLNKLGLLVADPQVRALLGQREHCLDLRQLMDQGGWLLLNCARGQLGDAAYLLGSFAVASIQAAVMGRSDIAEEARVPFTLFLDEMQSVRSDELELLLSESRKFHCHLCLAHQHMAQAGKELEAAIFANCSSHIVFACSPADAAAICRHIPGAGITETMLIHQPVGQAILCRRGKPPVVLRVLPTYLPPVDENAFLAFTAERRARHGRPLEAVLSEIEARLRPPDSSGDSRPPARERGSRSGRAGTSKGGGTRRKPLEPPVEEYPDE